MKSFADLGARIGRFDVRGKTVLIPVMHPIGSELIAAGFRAVGVPALVMETGRGLELARELTSGKECFPCQVTLGDVLHHLKKEQARLGAAFSAGNYVYFMPESDGPCRFGMYNKFQRLVLDRFEEFREIPIASITTTNAYSTEGLVPDRDATAFRLLAYMLMILADVLDRVAWRTRPYERRPGAVDELLGRAVAEMARTIEAGGLTRDFKKFRDLAADTARSARALADTGRPRRPRIGIVGEIFLRCHPESNQELIRRIEEYGGEVIDASLSEWLSFITYCRARDHRRHAGHALRRRDFRAAGAGLRQWLGDTVEYHFLNRLRRRTYASALRHLDIVGDHSVHEAARQLDGEHHFSFDIGTESVLSISGALEYVRHGCDGIVNVFPFTCMPGAVASAVLNPLLAEKHVPYLEVPCDGTHQPNRETVIRTFVWQTAQRREHLAQSKTAGPARAH